MSTSRKAPKSIDEYIAAFSSEVQAILERIPVNDQKGCARRNLRFPLDQPIPYGLIGRIVKLRVKQNLAKAVEKRRR